MMIHFVESYEVQIEMIDSDTILISGILNLDEGKVHNMHYEVMRDDVHDFVECKEADILCNDDTVKISFFRNHLLIQEELEDEMLQFAADDSTKFFNTIVSWWHNR